MPTPEGEFELAGIPDIPHVADPERPFAAMMSAVSGFSIEAVQRTLDEAGLSEPDENLGKIRLEGKYRAVNVEPLQLRGAKGPEGILERIMDQLDEGTAVALYHRAHNNLEDPSYGWMLLTGSEIDGHNRSGKVQAIDPQRTDTASFGRYKMLEIIRNSTLDEELPRGIARIARKVTDYLRGADLDPKPTSGIHAFVVDPEYSHRPLTVIFEEESEETGPAPAVRDANAARHKAVTESTDPTLGASA